MRLEKIIFIFPSLANVFSAMTQSMRPNSGPALFIKLDFDGVLVTVVEVIGKQICWLVVIGSSYFPERSRSYLRGAWQ
jgi:hypothetical protein